MKYTFRHSAAYFITKSLIKSTFFSPFQFWFKLNVKFNCIWSTTKSTCSICVSNYLHIYIFSFISDNVFIIFNLLLMLISCYWVISTSHLAATRFPLPGTFSLYIHTVWHTVEAWVPHIGLRAWLFRCCTCSVNKACQTGIRCSYHSSCNKYTHLDTLKHKNQFENESALQF